jgi:hypothetical protein
MAMIKEGAPGYFWVDIVLDLMAQEEIVYGTFDVAKDQWERPPANLFYASNSVRYLTRLKRDVFTNEKGHQVWETYRIGIPKNWEYTVCWKHHIAAHIEGNENTLVTVYTPIFVAGNGRQQMNLDEAITLAVLLTTLTGEPHQPYSVGENLYNVSYKGGERIYTNLQQFYDEEWNMRDILEYIHVAIKMYRMIDPIGP